MGAGLIARTRAYVTYHAVDKWAFVYLVADVAAPIPAFPPPPGLEVRLADAADARQLDAEVLGRREGSEAYERRYLAGIGGPEIECWVGRLNGAIVHYSWVFRDATASPLAEVPFDPRHGRPGDAYVGPVFTDASARGFIYPFVLGRIVERLRAQGQRRVIVLVRGGRTSAVSFYRRLGFQEMTGVVRPRPFWVRWAAALLGTTKRGEA